MTNYIDGFVFPIAKHHLDEYKNAATQIAEIWKEYGALSYNEFVGDELSIEGTKSFTDQIDFKPDEVVIFGWVLFPDKEIRDSAHAKVATDSRMPDLVAPITTPGKAIFDASKMACGGFKALVQSSK